MSAAVTVRACPPPARSPPPAPPGPAGTLGSDSDPILPTRKQKQRGSMFWPKSHREKVIQWLHRNSNTHYTTMPSTFQKIPGGSIIPNLPLLTHLTPRVPLPQRTELSTVPHLRLTHCSLPGTPPNLVTRRAGHGPGLARPNQRCDRRAATRTRACICSFLN